MLHLYTTAANSGSSGTVSSSRTVHCCGPSIVHRRSTISTTIISGSVVSGSVVSSSNVSSSSRSTVTAVLVAAVGVLAVPV